MALEKTFTTDFGVMVQYHKILKIEYHSGRNDIEIVVAVYLNKEARDNNLKPAYIQHVPISMEHVDGDPRGLFYPLLKQYTKSYLLDATDSVEGTVPETYPPLSIKPEHRVQAYI